MIKGAAFAASAMLAAVVVIIACVLFFQLEATRIDLRKTQADVRHQQKQISLLTYIASAHTGLIGKTQTDIAQVVRNDKSLLRLIDRGSRHTLK